MSQDQPRVPLPDPVGCRVCGFRLDPVLPVDVHPMCEWDRDHAKAPDR